MTLLSEVPPHACWYAQQHTIGCVMSGKNGRGCACPTESVCRICAGARADGPGQQDRAAAYLCGGCGHTDRGPVAELLARMTAHWRAHRD